MLHLVLQTHETSNMDSVPCLMCISREKSLENVFIESFYTVFFRTAKQLQIFAAYSVQHTVDK